MSRADKYSLLLLAGGKSKRMGADKAKLLYNGKTFVDNLIDKAECLGITKVYLSGYQEVHEKAISVKDICPGIGPLGGIHAGLKKIETPYCLVLPVDVPQIPLGFLEKMLGDYENGDFEIYGKKIPFLLEQEGFLEPLIGIYPVDLWEFIEEKIKEEQLSVFRMLKQWGCECFRTDVPGWQLANINTQEEYKKLLEMTKRES